MLLSFTLRSLRDLRRNMSLLNSAMDHLNQPGSGVKFIWFIQIVCVFIIGLCVTSIYNGLGETARRSDDAEPANGKCSSLTWTPPPPSTQLCLT